MNAMTVAQRMTADEYLAWDGPRGTNLVEGEVVMRSERAFGHDDDPPYSLPDIAVEIRSPSTWRYDVGAKKTAYERHGLPELWLVDTAADEVLVFRRSAPDAPAFDVAEELSHGDTLTSPLLPGFALELDELFVEGS